jgi:quinol-cytochrome oxidoreductase complex cytochrome b subunit
MRSAGYVLEEMSDPDWELVKNPPSTTSPAENLPPAAEKDQCLHCHIMGEDKRLWTPLTRWVIFGSMGLVLVFGIVRSTWVWRNRKQWVPLTTRVGNWIEERYNLQEALSGILNKPVPDWATRWWYCLGGITAFLFVVQAVTGILLAFYYKPTPEAAYDSILFIENEVYFGASIRAIHHWSANGMIIMCVAHLLRVFIMGAFKNPRELNWISGVVLFIATMGFGFTGYLLPWDQKALWGSTVGSEILGIIPGIGPWLLGLLRGGMEITGLTLTRFYGIHMLVLPVLTFVFLGVHFVIIRRQGISGPL